MHEHEPVRDPAPWALWAPWITGVVLVASLAAWWAARASRTASLDERLASYAAPAVPARGDPVDDHLADLGAEVFLVRCSACHGLTAEHRLGPSLRGVTDRRDPEWILAMMLAPDSMTEHDAGARALKEEYGVQMLVPGGLEPTEGRALLEFLRRADLGAREPEG